MPPRPTTATTPSLRYWRTKRALLQRELAQRASVDLGTVQRLERDLPAKLDTVRRLAEALHVDPATLMDQPPDAE
jgi:transcriptional regulator with XRE-family HTH domain